MKKKKPVARTRYTTRAFPESRRLNGSLTCLFFYSTFAYIPPRPPPPPWSFENERTPLLETIWIAALLSRHRHFDTSPDWSGMEDQSINLIRGMVDDSRSS